MNKVICSVIFALFFTVGAPSLSYAYSANAVIFELVTGKDKDKKKKDKKKKKCCASKEAEAKKNCCAGKEEKKSCSGEQKEQ